MGLLEAAVQGHSLATSTSTSVHLTRHEDKTKFNELRLLLCFHCWHLFPLYTHTVIAKNNLWVYKQVVPVHLNFKQILAIGHFSDLITLPNRICVFI